MEWARPMLARIMLRQEFGREPTASEIGCQIGRLRRRSVSLPPLNTITAAFENGEEVRPFQCCIHIPTPTQSMLQRVYPWKLECEGYEENLQWEIAVAFPHHKNRATKPKEAGVSGKT